MSNRKNRSLRLAWWMSFVWILGNGAPGVAAAQAAASAEVVETYGRLPLSFEANVGQADEAVRFLSRGAGYTLSLTAHEAVLHLARKGQTEAVVTMGLAGGRRDPRIAGEGRQPTRSNYLLGGDPRRWHTAVANYDQVRYRDVYPGIDLVYHGSQSQLEYDFVLAPGADPGQIRMVFRGPERIALAPGGELVLSTAEGDLVHHPPVVYQEIAGERRPLAGRYVLHGKGRSRTVGFAVTGHDRTRPLVIDPVLGFSTYLGGYFDRGYAIAVDPTGSVYVAGKINDDAFVTKIDAAGTRIVYSTLLGGAGADQAHAIAVDSEGSAYVAGRTNSSTFSGVNASSIQASNTLGVFSGFATKLDAAGGIVYSTFLGGSKSDWATGIAVDSARRAYVTGLTTSSDFIGVTPSSLQPQIGDAQDAFVIRIDPQGKLDYSTFLGGDGSDEASGIAVDSAQSAYVMGRTFSSRFPGATGTNAGGRDIFVAKLNAAGRGIDYSTLLGGDSGADSAGGIAVDAARNAYVTGTTAASRFTGVTGSSMQPNSGGGLDAFVTKLDAAGGIAYSTFLGGFSVDQGRGIAVDATGSVTILGDTQLGHSVLDPFPGVVGTSIQSSRRGWTDVFVVKLDPVGALVYSTFLGGGDMDEAGGIAVDGVGDAYVTGLTLSSDFPGVDARSIQPTASKGGVFVAKIQTRLQRYWMAVASAGTVDESAAGFYAATDAALGYLPGSTVVGQPVVARYRVINTTNTDVAPWDTLELGYFDNAPGSSVTARLIRVDPCTGVPAAICTVTSADAASPTCRACTFSTPLDFPHYLYYVEVTLLRQTPDLSPQALTLRLY